MILENCHWSDAMANSGSEVLMEKKVEWTHEETVLLLNLYESCLENIGPMKQFKNKKQMWIFLGTELAKSGIDRTGMQCENRYKTVYKRKKKNNELNSIIESAASRNNAEHNNNLESAISTIAAEDDAASNPRIQISHCYTDTSYVQDDDDDDSSSSSNAAPNSPPPPTKSFQKRKRKKRDWESELCEVLQKIAETRERNKKARHDEKMELLRKLLE